MYKYLAWILSPISFLFLAVPAFAQSANPCPGGIFERLCQFTGNNAGSILGQIITFIFAVAVIIAVLYLIYGGIKWIMSRGDKTEVEAARNHIVAAVAGLIVVFLAFFIISVILRIFTGHSITELKVPEIIP